MKIFQIIKRLNNTELNKKGMKDSYVTIPSRIGGKFIFNDKTEINFINKRNNVLVPISYTTPRREHRFNRLGPFFRSNDLDAGDGVIFERIISDEGKEFHYIDFLKFSNNFIFQKTPKGFALLKGDINTLTTLNNNIKNSEFHIKRLGKFKIKSNSRDFTSVYDLFLENKNLLIKVPKDGVIEIKVNNKKLELIHVNTCVAHVMEV